MPQASAALRFVAPLLLVALAPGWVADARADTQTVRVRVRFIERIHVGHGSDDEAPDSATVATSTTLASSATSSGTTPAADETVQTAQPDNTFVTALSVQATPHRAFTFNVTAEGSDPPTDFVCSYGEYRQAPCGAAGLPVTSVAADELRIDQVPASTGPIAPDDAQPPTEIQVTIAYQ